MQFSRYLKETARRAGRWERRLFVLLNTRLGSRRLDALMRFLSGLGSAWASVGLCLFFWSVPGWRGLAMPLSFSVAGSHMTARALKRLLGRQRPYGVVPAMRTVTARLWDASFPSGHTTAAFSVAGIVSAATGASLPVWTLASLVGVSRIYLGHHYPTDVLGGAALGAGFAALAVHLFS